MNEEFKKIKKFLISSFGDNFIIYDNRILPFLSGVYKDYDFFSLKSLKIYIIGNTKNIEAYYPNGNIKREYENLINNNIVLDLCICSKNYYDNIKLKSYMFGNIYCYIDEGKTGIEFSDKLNLYSTEIIRHIQSDNNDININISNFIYDYKRHLSLFLIKDNSYKYMEKFTMIYLKPKIQSLKNKIKYYKFLKKEGYKTLDDALNQKKVSIKKIQYLKNISVKKEKYTGLIHKVYNISSSKKMKNGYIMVAENTNPEFIDSFYRAKFIAVETNSELSHASITCKELQIPLALGATNIFLASESGKQINIDTNNNIINL